MQLEVLHHLPPELGVWLDLFVDLHITVSEVGRRVASYKIQESRPKGPRTMQAIARYLF